VLQYQGREPVGGNTTSVSAMPDQRYDIALAMHQLAPVPN